MAHHLDFFVRFRFAFRPEKAVSRANTDFIGGEFLGVTKRKIGRNDCRLYAALTQKMRNNFFVRRRLLRFPLHFVLKLAEHDKFICVGLLAASIDFQIAQDKRALAVSLQKNEWIGRPKLCRVQHIRVGVACSDNQARWFGFSFGHSMLVASLRPIAMLVIPSEERDLPRRVASHKQNLSNASPNVRSFAVCAAQDDPWKP